MRAPQVALPGSPGEGPADVEVRVATEDEVAGAFSGPADPPRSARRRVDGLDVLYERGAAGDLRILWEDAGAFHVAPGAALVLAWAPQGPDAAWTRFLLDSVLSSVAMRRGAEALHAGTVALTGDLGAVAIAAGQGGGKTTLVGALIGDGGMLVADDISVVRRGDTGFVVEPGPPVMNVASEPPPGATPASDLGEVLARLDEELWVAARRTAGEAIPLRAVVQLERRAGAELGVRRIAPGPAILLAHLLDSGPERRRARFELVADLAASVPFLVLDAPLETDPRRMARLLRRAVADT